eukprot:UN23274
MEDHTFMTLFESGSLEKFDHYYKLKALYMYMIKDGKQQGFENASKYIKVYEKDKYNYTITYFWAHVVYYSQSTQVGSGFKTLIVVNKCLTDSEYYLKFYDSDILNNEKAMKVFIQPTKLPLPKINADTPIAPLLDNPMSLEKPSHTSSADEIFIKDIESQNLNSWSHQYYVRVIWCYLSTIENKKT